MSDSKRYFPSLLMCVVVCSEEERPSRHRDHSHYGRERNRESSGRDAESDRRRERRHRDRSERHRSSHRYEMSETTNVTRGDRYFSNNQYWKTMYCSCFGKKVSAKFIDVNYVNAKNVPIVKSFLFYVKH